jgi:hypothetical protein
MAEIVLRYDERPWFRRFHRRAERWAILVYHRRAGKTVAAVNDLISKTLYNTRNNPRYGYIAPLYNQAKQIAWQYLKDFTAPLQPKISESGLYVEFPQNGGRITLYGADNPDAFRGLYFDGLVLDEYGNMRPSVWTEVLLPTLVDRRGWAVFMGTPNGPNHFRDMWIRANDVEDGRGWLHEMYTVEDTKIIPAEDLAEIRRMMTPEEYEQEMMCSFSASTRGAYYAREIEQLERSGRITQLEPDCTELNFSLDLGYRDDTSMWAWQNRPDGFAILRAAAANTRPVSFYIGLIHTICAQLAVPRGTIWLPHDARAKTLATNRSVVEQFMDAGIRPKIIPKLELQDGIQATRLILPDCYFDEAGTKDGLLALKSYHREYDEDRKSYRDQPVHDWSSHYADAFRGLAVVCSKSVTTKTREQTLAEIAQASNGLYSFALQDLWDLQPTKASRIP